MKEKIVALILAFLKLIGEQVAEVGGFSKLSFFAVISKVISTRLWSMLGGIAAGLMWERLGVPQEQLVDYWLLLGSLVGGFMGLRTLTDMKSIAADKANPT